VTHFDPDEVVVHCGECGARLFNVHKDEARQDVRIQYSGGNHASQPCPYAKRGGSKRPKMGCE